MSGPAMTLVGLAMTTLGLVLLVRNAHIRARGSAVERRRLPQTPQYPGTSDGGDYNIVHAKRSGGYSLFRDYSAQRAALLAVWLQWRYPGESVTIIAPPDPMLGYVPSERLPTRPKRIKRAPLMLEATVVDESPAVVPVDLDRLVEENRAAR